MREPNGYRHVQSAALLQRSISCDLLSAGREPEKTATKEQLAVQAMEEEFRHVKNQEVRRFLEVIAGSNEHIYIFRSVKPHAAGN